MAASPPPAEPVIAVALVGGPGVGKTALVHRLVSGAYEARRHPPSVGPGRAPGAALFSAALASTPAAARFFPSGKVVFSLVEVTSVGGPEDVQAFPDFDAVVGVFDATRPHTVHHVFSGGSIIGAGSGRPLGFAALRSREDDGLADWDPFPPRAPLYRLSAETSPTPELHGLFVGLAARSLGLPAWALRPAEA